jgi:serine beta-lactamase-like protein LACTB
VLLGSRALLAATLSVTVPGGALASTELATALAPASSPPPAAAVELGPASGPVARLPPARVEAIEVVVANEMARRGIPGLSVAIGHEDQLVFANGYGFADVENFVPARSDTAYRLASISKALTAVAVLQLAEGGELDLDAPVQRYCPAFPLKRWPLTPRHLLAHQGGVRHYREGERPMTRHWATVEEGLSLFKDDPLEFEPGTDILYSTYGYSLLGCVVEGVTGRPFLAALREAVLRPAGMGRTNADDVYALIPNRARGYTRDLRGQLINCALADTSYKVPGGGLIGTAPDVARFGMALLAGRLLGAEWREKMLTPGRTRDGCTAGHGLGISVGEHEGEAEIWKDGSQAGVSGLLYLGGGRGPVVALLANHEGVAPHLRSVARRIARLLVAAREPEP